MATVFYVGNAQKTAQVDTMLVTAVSVGGTLSAIINTKTITYTCITGDTTATAAAGWVALLAASTAPPEFGEVQWSLSGSTVIGTSGTPGNPFTLTKSQGGGATCTLTHLTANVSPSDVADNNNWLRGGSPGIPQNNDIVILKALNIPLLWNLDALAAVQFASFTRWQSFVAQIGLPDQNPAGYLEYRPTRFKFIGNANPISIILGQGSGSRTALERYNFLTQQVAIYAIGGTAIDIINVNSNSTYSVNNATVSVAAGASETSSISSGIVDGGGSLTLGSGVSFGFTLTVTQGTATLYCAVPAIVASNGAQVTVASTGTTYPSVTATLNSTITWLSDATVSALTLRSGSTFDKSQDIRPIVIATSQLDGDTCRVLDPVSVITWSSACIVSGQVTQGPFTFLGQRTVRIV